jgi:hypothetical protein
MGIRFTRGGSPSRFMRRASIDGVATPVTVTKIRASTSAVERFARARPSRTACSPISWATRIQALFASPQVASRSYSSMGSAR